ncbi:hypothetical protein DV515_00017832 [Chloebia gouldiae]|uniref:Uncharacterized protein n=1 Tax=Chloebia gouldiae TaxID=44316 RepID=A0A3L8Q9E6_CHLGU|nr:hypothetical protein DV515_00017832 [Chloebia gouldiae]
MVTFNSHMDWSDPPQTRETEDYTRCPDWTGKLLHRPWSVSSASATPGATVCGDIPFKKDKDLVWDQLLSWQQVSRGFTSSLSSGELSEEKALPGVGLSDPCLMLIPFAPLPAPSKRLKDPPQPHGTAADPGMFPAPLLGGLGGSRALPVCGTAAAAASSA